MPLTAQVSAKVLWKKKTYRTTKYEPVLGRLQFWAPLELNGLSLDLVWVCMQYSWSASCGHDISELRIHTYKGMFNWNKFEKHEEQGRAISHKKINFYLSSIFCYLFYLIILILFGSSRKPLDLFLLLFLLLFFILIQAHTLIWHVIRPLLKDYKQNLFLFFCGLPSFLCFLFDLFTWQAKMNFFGDFR